MPRLFSSSSYDTSSSYNTLGNPNPKNFKILRVIKIGKYLVVKIKYPDSNNYEGIKILIYKGSLLKLKKQKTLDPHFSETKRFMVPIARFEPTEFGWKAAIRIAYCLTREL